MVDGAVASPTDAEGTLNAHRVENSYPTRLPQPLFDRGAIAEDFFLCPDSEKTAS
jgi:hypothetical protein